MKITVLVCEIIKKKKNSGLAMENIRTELRNILFQDIKITFAMTSVAFILKKKIYKLIVFI